MSSNASSSPPRPPLANTGSSSMNLRPIVMPQETRMRARSITSNPHQCGMVCISPVLETESADEAGTSSTDAYLEDDTASSCPSTPPLRPIWSFGVIPPLHTPYVEAGLSLPNLPLSSPPHKKSLAALLPPILILLGIFCTSLLFIAFLISTIPTLALPHNLEQVKQQTILLKQYSQKGAYEGLHVSFVLTTLFLFKQAFSIPGSILMNIVFGALYGTIPATVLACVFTGVGSIFAYLMGSLSAPLVERYLPKALEKTRNHMHSKSTDLFSYLLLARLFPLLPYSVLNVICGVLHIPILPYFYTLVLGSFPYNYVTTSLGDLINTLASTSASADNMGIWSPALVAKLLVASVLSAVPLVFKDTIRRLLSSTPPTEEAEYKQVHMSQADPHDDDIPSMWMGRRRASVQVSPILPP